MAGSGDEASGTDRSWFVYSRTGGRVTAAPASLEGWAALAACLAVMWSTLGLHPLIRFGLFSAVLAAGILLTAKLAVAKGRRAE